MFREGHDLLELAFRRVRAAGVPALAGFRMNDHHGDEPTYTPWQRAHVDWSLGKDTRQTNCYLAVGELRQMDYAVAEVRAHHLAILEEVLGRQQAILRFKTLNATAAGLTVALNDVALGAPRHVTTPDAERPHLLLWEFAVGTPPLRRGDNAIKFASRHARDGAMEIGELDILVPADGDQ